MIEPAPDRRAALLGLASAGLAVAACAPATAPAAPVPQGRRFADQIVLITGATSGIGRAAAEAWAAEGARVVFCGRRAALGREVEQGIRARSGQAWYVQADVRRPDQVRAFVDGAVARHGRIDIALNNAGISFDGPLHEIDLEAWENLQATNVRGVLLAMQAELRHMLAAGQGQILCTASANVAASRPDLGAYNASKRAVASLVQTAALEYGRRGVRVNAICPGATDTEMIRRQAGMMQAPDPVWRAGLGVWANGNAHGLGRVAQPAEIAAAILALTAPGMTYLNGSLVFVDGGMTASL